jgi:hypothetical protein
MANKICSRCKQLKALSEFTRNKRKADGLSGQCRECRREYRERTNNDIIYKKVLCNKCNLLLGLAEENCEILKRAIVYLKKHFNCGISCT